MTNLEIKLQFLKKLEARDVWGRRVSENQYVTRCPFCGDSEKLNHGHFYILLNLDNNYNMGYNCFKCPAHGAITKEVCHRLGIDDVDMLSNIVTLEKTSDKSDSKHISGEEIQIFPYELPEVTLGRKTEYMEKRMGRYFSREDHKVMKTITSLEAFCIHNKITKLPCPRQFAEMLEANYVGFLSYGNSHILFRDTTGKMKDSWIKFPINVESRKNRILYSLSSEIDLYTRGEIQINLCEGVFDAIGIYFNLEYHAPNTITFAVSGKFYEPVLIYLIGMGLYGDNVSVNIFADNDESFGKHKVAHSELSFYQKMFQNMKYLFKRVRVFYNQKSKDCGVPKEEIELKEYKL